MESLIRLLILSLVLLATYQESKGLEISYQNGVEYQYWYESQILIGIPEGSNQYSGLKVQALAKVLVRKSACFLQLANISVGRINTEVTEPPSHSIPFSRFNEIGGEEGQIYVEHLSKTVKFKYENGIIRDLESRQDDALWSVNIKKGVLTTLQVNLHQHKALDLENDDRLKNKLKTQEDEKYYRVMEDGAGGECETIYTIQRIPDKSVNLKADVSIYNVTKVRNYQNCLEKPVWRDGLFTEKGCPKCKDKENELLDSNTRGWYGLKAQNKELIIEFAIMNGQHVFHPYQEHEGSVTVFVLQLLTLQSTLTKATVDTKSLQNTVTWKNLHYRFFNMDFVNEMDNKELSKIRDSEEIENILKSVENLPSYKDQTGLITKVMLCITYGTGETIDMNVLTCTETLITLLYFASLEQFHEAYTSIKQHNNPKMINLYFDIIAMIGSKPAFRFIKEMISTEVLKGPSAVHLMASMAITVFKPNADIIDEQMILCETDVVRNNPFLYNACWLTVGVWINSACVYKNSHRGDYLSRKYVVCSTDTREKYYKALVSNIGSSNADAKRMLFIKTLGNAGLEESLEDIKQIIYDGRLSRDLRVHAVYSLRRIASAQPQKVLGVVLPVYQDTTLDYEIRIASFIIIMNTGPSLAILKMIGQKLEYETSKQLSSFVYSHFIELSNLTQPCYKDLANDITKVLQFTKPIKYGIMDSRLSHSYFYLDNLKIGGGVSRAIIADDNGIFPRAATLKFNAQVLGFSMNFIETGIQFDNLQKLVDKIIEPLGKQGQQKKSFFDLIRKSRHVNTVDKETKEIKDMFKTSHQYGNAKSTWYLKLFGNEVFYTDITEELLKQLMNDGSVPVSDLEKKLKNGLNVDFTEAQLMARSLYMISTEVGLPVRLDVMIPAVVSVSGTIKGSMDNTDQSSVKPNTATLELNLKTNIASEVFGRVGVYGTFMDTGVAINSKLKIAVPISAKIEYDFDTSTSTIKIDTPEKNQELFFVETIPKTYSMHVPTKIGDDRPPFDIHIIEDTTKKPIQHDICLGEDLLGIKINLQSRIIRQSKRWHAPFYPLNGHHYLKLMVGQVPDEKKQTTQFEIQFNHKTFFMNKADDEDLNDVFANVEAEELNIDKSDLPDYLSRSLHKCKFSFTCKGVTERSLIYEANLLSYEGSVYNKYDLKIEHKNDLLGNRKICSAGEMKYPHKLTWDYDDTVARKADGYGYVQWGSDCSSGSEIIFKLTASKSKEALDYEKKETENSDHRRAIYSTCESDRKNGRKYSYACTVLMRHYYKLENYKLDIEYEKIPSWFRKFVHHISEALRSHYFDYALFDDVDIKNKADTLTAEINLDYNNTNIISGTIKCPKENVAFYDLELPFSIQPLSLKTKWKKTFLQFLANDQYYPYCGALVDEVRTFDGHMYKTHFSNCFHIFARDCSQNDHFTVLVADVDGPVPHSKEIKVFVDGHKLEILPVQQANEKYEWVLRIDGSHHEMKHGDHHHHFEVKDDPKSQCIFHIKLRDLYIIKIPDLGIDIKFDGVYIKITVTHHYRGKLCGMCGDLDGEVNNEFVGPDGREYTDGRQFSLNYAIPSDRCNIDEIYDQLGLAKEACVAVYRNKKIVRDQETCFSTEPIIECPVGCDKLATETKTLHFHCLPTKEKITKNLIRESKDRVLKNLTNKKIFFHQEFSYPSGCASVN